MTTVETRVAPEPKSIHPQVNDIAWKDAPRIIGSGVCMGTADLIPGVSGGTMAVACGIYREFLAAITSVNLEAAGALLRGRIARTLTVVHWRFIVCLGSGMAVALIVMGKIFKLPELLTTDPKPVYAVFFGLVLASVWVLAKRVERWGLSGTISILLGTVFGFIVVTLVPVQTPDNPLFIFFCGVIAISAMILPGISGSFILLVLGKYEHVISAVLTLDLSVVVPFALGCIVGIAAFSRVLGYLLDRFHSIMVAGLTGLLVGSLIRIWPYQQLEMAVVRGKERVVSAHAFWPQQFEWSVAALMVFGLVLVIGIEMLAARRAQT